MLVPFVTRPGDIFMFLKQKKAPMTNLVYDNCHY